RTGDTVAQRTRRYHCPSDWEEMGRQRGRGGELPGRPVPLRHRSALARTRPIEGVEGQSATQRERRLSSRRRPIAVATEPRRLAMQELPPALDPEDSTPVVSCVAVRGDP